MMSDFDDFSRDRASESGLFLLRSALVTSIYVPLEIPLGIDNGITLHAQCMLCACPAQHACHIHFDMMLLPTD
eukprot:scaffold1366_cov155-Skeletonema_menzelii.AAC.4